MTQPFPCRLLHHPPAAGAWNMAVDEMLLDGAAERAAPCLRIYAWNEPTLSLGYFQTYADRQQHAASRHCAAVRRLTGGGAIMHDQEITYSIVLPGSHPLAARRDELYQAMHGCLIETLAGYGAAARLCKGNTDGKSSTGATGREPFLCFQRRSPGDVLLGEHKICGSAQRRRNEAVLQHGSLLWRTSPAAPELPGVADLAGRLIPLMYLVDSWLDGLARRLGFAWRRDKLDETEIDTAQALAECRYGGDGWTKYRGRSAAAGQIVPTASMNPDR
jgi:lipoate-protein ligase A